MSRGRPTTADINPKYLPQAYALAAAQGGRGLVMNLQMGGGRLPKGGGVCTEKPKGSTVVRPVKSAAGWRTVGGKRFYARSRWEANYARVLELYKRSGKLKDWEHEPKTFWFLNIKRGVRSYLPDFRVTFRDGSVEYHEVKGWMDPRSATKIKRMEKYYPSVDLIIRDGAWYKRCQPMFQKLIPDWECDADRKKSISRVVRPNGGSQ